MNNRAAIGILLASIFFVFSTCKKVQEKHLTLDDTKNNGLKEFKSTINSSNINTFGLLSVDDTSKLSIENPILMYAIRHDKLKSYSGSEDIIDATSFLYYPVTINSKIIGSVIIDSAKQEFRAVKIGGNAKAVYLREFITKINTEQVYENKDISIVDIPSTGMSFVRCYKSGIPWMMGRYNSSGLLINVDKKLTDLLTELKIYVNDTTKGGGKGYNPPKDTDSVKAEIISVPDSMVQGTDYKIEVKITNHGTKVKSINLIDTKVFGPFKIKEQTKTNLNLKPGESKNVYYKVKPLKSGKYYPNDTTQTKQKVSLQKKEEQKDIDVRFSIDKKKIGDKKKSVKVSPPAKKKTNSNQDNNY